MCPKTRSSRSIDRALTLLALVTVAAFEYGPRIVLLCAAAAAAAMTAELVCLYLRGIPFRLKHLDAAAAGILTVMLMPPTVSVSLVIMSVIFAIIIGRQFFGGRENPVIPAPAVGFCFAMLNSRAEMTMFPAEKGILPLWDTSGVTLSEGISPLWNRTGEFTGDVMRWVTGLPAQPLGMTSLLLLGVIALILMLRRSASGFVFFPMMLFLIAGNIAYSGFHNPAATAAGACLTNQTLICVIYFYCDPDFAPPHIGGMLYGMISAILILVLTRIFAVQDAPVLLTILLSPAALFLNSVLRKDSEKQPLPKGGDSQLA